MLGPNLLVIDRTVVGVPDDKDAQTATVFVIHDRGKFLQNRLAWLANIGTSGRKQNVVRKPADAGRRIELELRKPFVEFLNLRGRFRRQRARLAALTVEQAHVPLLELASLQLEIVEPLVRDGESLLKLLRTSGSLRIRGGQPLVLLIELRVLRLRVARAETRPVRTARETKD